MTLTGAVHLHHNVDVVVIPANEARAELGVEDVGDVTGQTPGEDREGRRAHEGGFGGAVVVGVSGDPSFVEDEEEVGTDLVDHGGDLIRQILQGLLCERSVLTVEQLDPPDTERRGRAGKLGAAGLGQCPL